MKAVLLAAGLGTRLRPLTDSVPKCLVQIRGRPLLDIWLESLTSVGIGSVLVNTHYRPDAVERYVASSVFRESVQLVHEPALLGTAGTLAANAGFLGGEPALVAHADNYCLCDLGRFLGAHRDRPEGTVITMMTFFTDSPSSCGIVELDARQVVKRFHEKISNPPGNLANGAVYIFEPEVIDWMISRARPFLDISTDVLPHFLGRIHAWHNPGIHRDIGTLESWRAAQSEGFADD